MRPHPKEGNSMNIFKQLLGATLLSMGAFGLFIACGDETACESEADCASGEMCIDSVCDDGSGNNGAANNGGANNGTCLLYTSPSPRDLSTSRMPSSA